MYMYMYTCCSNPMFQTTAMVTRADRMKVLEQFFEENLHDFMNESAQDTYSPTEMAGSPSPSPERTKAKPMPCKRKPITQGRSSSSGNRKLPLPTMAPKEEPQRLYWEKKGWNTPPPPELPSMPPAPDIAGQLPGGAPATVNAPTREPPPPPPPAPPPPPPPPPSPQDKPANGAQVPIPTININDAQVPANDVQGMIHHWRQQPIRIGQLGGTNDVQVPANGDQLDIPMTNVNGVRVPIPPPPAAAVKPDGWPDDAWAAFDKNGYNASFWKRHYQVQKTLPHPEYILWRMKNPIPTDIEQARAFDERAPTWDALMQKKWDLYKESMKESMSKTSTAN